MTIRRAKSIKKKKFQPNYSLNKYSENFPVINFDEKNLITLDQTKIRNQALGVCQRTLKKIDKAKQEIDQFQKVDKPAYERWIQQNFGDLIEKIRSSSIEIHEKRALIDEIQEEAFKQKITFIEAYKIIKYKKDHPEEFKEPEIPLEEDDFEKDDPMDEEERFREELNEFFEKFNGKFNMNDEEFESLRRNLRNGSNDKNKDLDARLKERYRLIVQKLHPDKNKKASPMEKDLWYEAQESYRQKDLEKLDFIIALYNVRFGSIGIDSSIFDLQFANSKLEKSLKQFSQMIKRAKHDPGWLFQKLKPNKLESLRKEAAKEFKDYEKNTSNELREINNILDKWQKASMAMGNKNYPKSSQKQREDDFLNFYVNF
ncbi:MAG: hypothetical protein KBA66_02725 [Leptospiraceae bacterium]|nr:hypothetical protein [Leptospiraceae bacterium]